MVTINEEDYLSHIGTPRHSGRYPWGSGGDDNIAQRNMSFSDHVKEMRKQGVKDVDIAKGFGISTTQLRAKMTIERQEQRASQIAMAQRLREKGYSHGAIAERMGLPGESSVRALLAPGVKDRNEVLTQTTDMLKRQVDEKGLIDIGAGNEHYIGISSEKLNAAVAILKEKGYTVHNVPVPQIGTGKDTQQKVLAPPGTTWGEVMKNRDNIKSITDYSQDGGRSFVKLREPLSISPKRVGIVYKEDGGDKADGVIYVRRGVEDVSLGGNNYAQVRIKVGDGHYLKGMAMYKDDMPDGVDLLVNTNKTNTGNKLDAMKKISDDPDLPFGAIVRQITKDGGTPNERVISVMNTVGGKEGAGAEGSWNTWSRTLSSQMLSKQTPGLAKEQLSLTHSRRQKELDEIMTLTNPTVKKKLLEDFADSTDSAAVHLKAANLPRQANKVILPINSLKDTEVFAPTFRDGERVALIRFPHGGTFEIPELTVNNRNREGRKLIGSSAIDAIGINHKVANRLSGADFDGDTVLVIPNSKGKIKTSPPLAGLKNFDPKASYPGYDGMPPLTSRRKQQLMGDVSNLVTDMTLRGASHEKIARAVRHSMVVIDAEKHNLNWRQSAIDNGIPALKKEFQGGSRAGASTLISKKKKTERVPQRKLRPASEGGPIDKKTGKKVYVETGATRRLPSGERVLIKEKVKLLDLTDDAHTMSSGTTMERIYADHSNRLKNLANKARLASLNTPPLQRVPSSARTYSRQVDSLSSKLALAEMNAPRERQAQVIANSIVKAKRQANPDLDDETLKKIKFQALTDARTRMGVGKQKIEITQDEWNAIQAGAISNQKLRDILKHADMDVVRKYATPRAKRLMSSTSTARARAMLADGYTRADVADALGVSLATLDQSLAG